MGDEPSSTSVTHDTPAGIPGSRSPGSPAAGAPRREAEVPWRGWAVGTRVVVRHRLPDGDLSDALGELREVGPAGVLVQTRRGPVRVAGEAIVLGKPVPPPPPRRPARGSAARPDGDSGRR